MCSIYYLQDFIIARNKISISLKGKIGRRWKMKCDVYLSRARG